MARPDEAAAPRDRARALVAAGRGADALAILESCGPPDRALAMLRGDALVLAGRAAEAAAAFAALATAAPGDYEAWWGLGCAELERDRPVPAIAALRRAAALNPASVPARHNLAKALAKTGRAGEAAAIFAVLAADPGAGRLPLDALAVWGPGVPELDNAAVRAIRERWAAAARAALPAPPPRPAVEPVGNRKLRVGYCSAFFGAENYMKFVWGAVNAHDRGRFELHFFSDDDKPPSAGYRDHPADRFHAVRGAPNAGLADYVRAQRIDVLVDLSSYSFLPRLPLFLCNPAPVLVAWISMYATSGMAEFDLLVGDDATVRAAEAADYTETWREALPVSYLAFEVPYAVPEVSAPPLAAGGPIRFGSFCSHYKFTDQTLAAWAAILRTAPGATLLLRNRALGEATTGNDLRARFAEAGGDPSRLILEGPAAHAALLAAYAGIDVALDAFPYNGGTTTAEALWQGVPVLTTDGDRWAARTSASLLRAAGLDEWVMPDAAAMAARAAGLAANPAGTAAMLGELRQGMRDRLRASAACDVTAQCRAMEALYERAVRDRCAAAPMATGV